MNSKNNLPLTEDELMTLDGFLLMDEHAGDRLSIDEVHGYLTSLIVAAVPTEQEKWMEVVWGSPEFSDQAEKERMTEYLLRMYWEIAETMGDGRSFEPLIVEEEDEAGVQYEVYEGWCFGFMRGVTEHQKLWEDVPKNEQELLTPIAKLAMSCMEDDEQEMSDEEYEACVDLLPGALSGLYAYWHADQS